MTLSQTHAQHQAFVGLLMLVNSSRSRAAGEIYGLRLGGVRQQQPETGSSRNPSAREW